MNDRNNFSIFKGNFNKYIDKDIIKYFNNNNRLIIHNFAFGRYQITFYNENIFKLI